MGKSKQKLFDNVFYIISKTFYGSFFSYLDPTCYHINCILHSLKKIEKRITIGEVLSCKGEYIKQKCALCHNN